MNQRPLGYENKDGREKAYVLYKTKSNSLIRLLMYAKITGILLDPRWTFVSVEAQFWTLFWTLKADGGE